MNSRKEIRDDAFDYRFVEMMSLILLTSAETVSLRNRLRVLSHIRFRTFCCNSLSCLSLCWLVEDYPMADIIVETLASKPLSLSFLVQADQLLKLLESSVFVHLRVHLVDVLNPTRYVMVRSLLRFMMLLPQVGA